MKQSTASKRVNSNNGRRQRFAITPIACAIRSVLAISGALIALSGSSAAIAGDCVSTAANTYSCNGDFTETLPGVMFPPVVDMTLILGDVSPTSVIPTAGQVGVDAVWDGNVGVTSFADIVTDGADGMYVLGTTSATVDNEGNITTYVNADGAMALKVYADGDVSIVNAGEVNAYGVGIYDVTAISAYSGDGDVLIDNLASGTITAQAQDGNAIAVLSYASGSATLTNAGVITASSNYGLAVGVLVQAYYGDASVTNSGRILTDSTYSQSIGVLVSSSNGYASLSNSGLIQAQGGEDQSFGVLAAGWLGSDIENTGTIAVLSSAGTAVAALSTTYDGHANASNIGNGYIYGFSSGSGDLVGLEAYSTNGTASVDNAGRIKLITRVGQNTAVGMAAYSDLGSSISNTGYVLAGSYSGRTIGGIALAQHGDVEVSNSASGYIRSRGVSYDAVASSFGLVARAYDGNADVNNSGTINAVSTHGNGVGIQVRATGGDASAENSGKVTAAGITYGDAVGISVLSYTGYSTVGNTGTVYAGSSMVLGEPLKDKNNVRAIESFGYDGATVSNTGTIQAFGAWYIRGVVAVANLGDVDVTSSEIGKIQVKGMNAYGIQAEAQYGDYTATVDNAGAIQVIQIGDCYCNALQRVGVGIKASALFYGGGVAVTNSGSIDIITQHNSYGIWAEAASSVYRDDVTVDNSGRINIFSTGYNSNNTGISAYSHYGDTSIVNSGDIRIEIGQENTLNNNVDVERGMSGNAGRPHNLPYEGGPRPDGGGDVYLDNSGTITILGGRAAYGMEARGNYQQAVTINSGDITVASDTVYSTGVGMFSWASDFRYAHDTSYFSDNGEAIVNNSGNVSVDVKYQARGLRALVSNKAGAQITNSGDVNVTAAGPLAYGVWVQSFNYRAPDSKDLSVANSGTIAAINHAGTADTDTKGGIRGVGVMVVDYTNNILVDNSGDIVADVTAGICSGPSRFSCFKGATVGSAVGILAASGRGPSHTYASGDIGIVNSGSITASVDSSSSTQTRHYAYFPKGAFASGVFALGNYADIAVTNAGDITVAAKGEGFSPILPFTLTGWATTAAGIMASSYGSRGDDVTEMVLTNSGAITVSAEATYADGTALAVGISGLVDNFQFSAYYQHDIQFRGNGDGNISASNDGSISVAALTTGDGMGAATANGISVINEATRGSVNISNNGSITASATGSGAVFATGILGSSSDAAAVILGAGSNLHATATGASGTAIGVSVSGDLITASNAGAINAQFIGGGDTYGALIASLTGDVTFTNSGSITATDADYAVGVQLDSLYATTLINSGTITAASTLAGSIAVRTGASTDLITNTGTINGALITGDGNDTLTNSVGGIWNAIGSSDFGAGDDTIVNAGTINLSNTTITLGSHGAAGNVFTNTGMIRVSGDSNTIDLGALNPKPFTNTGTISFMDGAPDDLLTIAGDFGGNGNISLDISGLHGTSDLLYINGNVVNGSVTTINAKVLDVPTTATGSVAMVNVSGNSSAGSFVLGNVTFDTTQSFLTVQGVSLHSVIDTSNATPDVFSMDFAVTGLTDTGTLAAAFAPGVQSLMNSQVGTWRQRMGVIDKTTSGPSVWARAFQDDGTVNPTHQANNFGQGGSFAFDQRNAGQEVGVDFGFSDQFSVGLLLGKAQARQHLSESATTTSKLDGTTSGVYGTWISPNGFYMDASYRHMSFDVKLSSAAGETRTHGKANAFNLEAGYAWTLGDGFKIEPQLQYTRTTVGNVDTLAGALAGFTPDGGASSRGRLGVAVRKSFGAGKTAWTPYATVSAVRESDGKNAYAINGNFSGSTSTEGTSALVEGGLNVKTGNLTVFGGVNWQDGGALKSVVGGQLGVRYSW